MIYQVYVYPVVKVLVRDVEAGSPEEACRKAEELAGLDNLFAVHRLDPHCRVGPVAYADGVQGFLVDMPDDPQHILSATYDHAYQRQD